LNYRNGTTEKEVDNRTEETKKVQNTTRRRAEKLKQEKSMRGHLCHTQIYFRDRRGGGEKNMER
jgi:hypothetical protein